MCTNTSYVYEYECIACLVIIIFIVLLRFIDCVFKYSLVYLDMLIRNFVLDIELDLPNLGSVCFLCACNHT